MDRPALLPIRKDLLQLPLSNQTHPLLTDRKRNFKLAAWPVSGNPSDSIKFLKGCPKLSLYHGGRVQKSTSSLPGMNSIAGVKNGQLIRFLVLQQKYFHFCLICNMMACNIGPLISIKAQSL